MQYTQKIDTVAKKHCRDVIEKCANFLPSFSLTAGNLKYPAASLKNLAIFAPFDFSQLSTDNQLPETLAVNLEHWYEYRTYHSTDPSKKSGALKRIGFKIAENSDNADQIEITCYHYDLWKRHWQWENLSSDKVHIINVNQHTELVIDYVHPILQPKGL